MAGKHPTQAIPADGRKGASDGTGVPTDARGAGGGGPIGPKGKRGTFRGGQSEAAYHGHGQLGEQDVPGEDNANAPSRAS